MAFNWNYNPDDYEEKSFELIPVGDHRVRIKNAEEAQSKNSGRDMIKLTLEVSGYSGILWHYIVFMPDNPKKTNEKLGQVFDSFGIQPGNLNIASWIGQVGGCRVKHGERDGEKREEIAYFLSHAKVEKLPAWKNGPGVASVTGGVVLDDDDELLF